LLEDQNSSSNTDDTNDLYQEVLDDLEARESWEDRQIIWAKMRTTGIRRPRKPWPLAADTHVPVGDTLINKLKAYYVQWILGPELLASFYSLDDQGDSYTDAVAQWFDYQVRECSNFSIALICAIDSLLQNGMGLLKTYWDAKKVSLAYASIHPYFVVVPSYTNDLNESDRVTHVMHLSEGEYKRDALKKGYNDDPDFIKSITGEGKPDQKYKEQRYSQEGLSWSNVKDLIVLWEVYKREDDGQLTVHTFSPLNPTEPARDTFKLPYRHKQCPILQLPYELIDQSYYSSRGVMELVQPFEASSCKMKNDKLDYMTLANRPVLSTQGGSINAQNIRYEPGAVYDSALTIVQQPPPPVSFDEEIQNDRGLAEQRVGIPDFGVGDQGGSQGKNKTATETNVISGVMQTGNDLRARLTKGSVTRVFEQSWSLLQQYNRKSLDYFWRKQRISLPDAAFDSAYVLRPNGSVDGYSRERDIQKLMQLRQLSQGSPWIKTAEIDKKIIELMDVQWIPVLYEEPADVQADQQYSQALENSTMLDGFLPQPKSSDDHVSHLQIIFGFIGWAQKQQPNPINPVTLPTFLQHATMHIEAARQDAEYMKMHAQEIAQAAQQVAMLQKQVAAQAQAQAQAQTVMQNLRGGGVSGAPVNGSGVSATSPMLPGAGAPPAPPGAPNLPQPGQPQANTPPGATPMSGLPS
jgi:hypothetical protein